MKKYILNTELTAESDGIALNQRYRAVIIHTEDKKLFQVDQEIKGEWFQTFNWDLRTIMVHPSDALWLDFGAGWKITSGIQAALAEYQETVRMEKQKSTMEACKKAYRQNGYTFEKDFPGEYYLMFNTETGEKVRLYYHGSVVEY